MNPINDQLRSLRLGHAINALEQQQEQLSTYAELGFEERLSLLLESEILGRNHAKIQRLKRQAKLRIEAQPSQITYKEGRGLKRPQMSELLTGGYLHKKQNVLITGPTGAGKTYVACALGSQACEQLHSVRYQRLSRLLDDLSSGRLDGTLRGSLSNKQHDHDKPITREGVVRHDRKRHRSRRIIGSTDTQQPPDRTRRRINAKTGAIRTDRVKIELEKSERLVVSG